MFNIDGRPRDPSRHVIPIDFDRAPEQKVSSEPSEPRTAIVARRACSPIQRELSRMSTRDRLLSALSHDALSTREEKGAALNKPKKQTKRTKENKHEARLGGLGAFTKLKKNGGICILDCRVDSRRDARGEPI